MQFLVEHVKTKGNVQNDPVLSRAVSRSIQVIGEAAKRVPEDIRKKYDHIPWKQMTGMRDVVVHEYDEIDIDQVWEVVDHNIPEVLPMIEEILEQEQ